jgi:transcriptional regulator
MHVPKAFLETRPERLHRLMREHPFALLVSIIDGRPFATHLPLMLDPARGPHGTLRGHVARGNPQWRGFDGRTELLAIFQGPHAYVSPRWYVGTPNVPTWNYATVHAYGPARRLEAPAALDRLLEDLIALNEAGQPEPWGRDQVPADYWDGMRGGIVGFEIEVARLEGKFKLNQNRTAEDRAGAARALAAQPDPLSRAVAALMAEDQDRVPASEPKP